MEEGGAEQRGRAGGGAGEVVSNVEDKRMEEVSVEERGVCGFFVVKTTNVLEIQRYLL